MGSPKALLDCDGEPFVRRIARRMDARLARVLVVCAEEQRAAYGAALRGLDGARLVVNPEPARGQLSSLQVALRHAPDADGWLAALVDHPDVAAATYAALVEAYRDAGRRDVVVLPRFGERRGHPLLWGAALRDELLAAPLDQGARVVTRRDASRVVAVAVDDAEVLRDVDRPGDYQRLLDARRGGGGGGTARS